MVGNFMRRRHDAGRWSSILATAMLTAAIFLLPATGEQRPARAADGEVRVTAVHFFHDATATEPVRAR